MDFATSDHRRPARIAALSAALAGIACAIFLFPPGVFAAGHPWLLNCRAAFKQAQRENKLVLIEFTGSDWCPPCVKLRQAALDTPEFLGFASTQLVLVELDFPQRKPVGELQRDHNAFFQRNYAVTGFPTLLLCDAEGRELGRLMGFSGQNGPALIEQLTKLRALPPANPPNVAQTP